MLGSIFQVESLFCLVLCKCHSLSLVSRVYQLLMSFASLVLLSQIYSPTKKQVSLRFFSTLWSQEIIHNRHSFLVITVSSLICNCVVTSFCNWKPLCLNVISRKKKIEAFFEVWGDSSSFLSYLLISGSCCTFLSCLDKYFFLLLLLFYFFSRSWCMSEKSELSQCIVWIMSAE